MREVYSVSAVVSQSASTYLEQWQSPVYCTSLLRRSARNRAPQVQILSVPPICIRETAVLWYVILADGQIIAGEEPEESPGTAGRSVWGGILCRGTTKLSLRSRVRTVQHQAE